MPNKPKPIAEMLNPASNLGRLKRHVGQIKRLEKELRRRLPSPLGEDYSWSVGNFRDRHLTLFTENPGQASRLRFMQQQFLENVQSIQSGIETISIKVIYQGAEREEPKKPSRKLSQEAAENISASAEHIKDSELKAVLQRLSQHAGRG